MNLKWSNFKEMQKRILGNSVGTSGGLHEAVRSMLR